MQKFLTSESLTRLHFYLVGFLALIYLIQAALFISSIENMGPSPFRGVKRLEGLLLMYFLIGAALYTLLQFISLLVWKISKMLDGVGGLKETRLALTWSLIFTLPFGFFFLIFQYTLHYPQGSFVKVLDGVSLLGIPFFLIYGWVALIKGLSEVQKFSIWKACAACFSSFLLIGLSIYLLISVRNIIGF